MGISVVWDNAEKTILRYDIQGAWTWDELRAAMDEIFTRMDESPVPRIGTIANFVEGVKVPGDAVRRVGEFTGRGHPRAGLTVIVGAGFLLKTAFAGLKRAAALAGKSVDFAYADNLAQARTIISRDSAG
ncbi:MAG: hypothetical protein SF029_12290 [bacterium]|nr:hypothetical protein [bacterium]